MIEWFLIICGLLLTIVFYYVGKYEGFIDGFEKAKSLMESELTRAVTRS